MHKEQKIYLSIAGFNILCIIYIHDKMFHTNKFIEMIFEDYSGFISKKVKNPDFRIIVDFAGHSVIEIKENKKSKDVDYYFRIFHFSQKENFVYLDNPVGNYQFGFLLQNIINKYLFSANDFSLHGSMVSYKNNAYIFEGKSGAGKSTTAQMLKGLCNILSDDMLYVRKINERFYSFQPAIFEKNYNFEKSGKAFLIKKVFFVKKADKCSLREIKDKKVILDKILQQVFTYNEKIKMQLPVLIDFVNKSDFYYFYIKKDEKLFKKFFKEEILKNEI